MKISISIIILLLQSTIVLSQELNKDILKSESYLRQMSNELNKILPYRVDKHIELSTTLGESSIFTLVYRTVNLSSNEANKLNFINGIRESSIDFICSDTTFKNLLDADVKIIALYVDMNMHTIGSIHATKYNCK